jgi:hypothetical protein
MKASDSILWVIPARPLSCICSASSLLFSVVEGRDPGFTGTKTCDVCLRLRSSPITIIVQRPASSTNNPHFKVYFTSTYPSLSLGDTNLPTIAHTSTHDTLMTR